jgi:hypothetical protein
MAYARFGFKHKPKSHVYVIGTLYSLECVSCRLDPTNPYGWFDTTSRTAMLKHLQEHRQRRQYVPWAATRRLKREIRQVGDNYAAW